MFDLVIKNALVLDGSGKEGYLSDVAIEGGKIAAIGKDLADAHKTIDATGLAVSPGWIDSHSHSDRAILTYPDQKEKVEQGITFSVTGQCGGSVAPTKELTVADFMEQATVTPQGSGSAMLIGHNSLRTAVMGKENRDPTPEELEQMKQLLADGLDAGAIGLSLGLYYVPGCYAKQEEVVALAKIVAQKKGILAAHMRNESDKLVEALEEYLQIIAASGCRAVVSHHKACVKQNWGKVKTTLAMIDRANANGLDVYMDVYPYIATHTTLLARFLPVQFHPPGTTNALHLLDDPQICNAAKEWGKDCWGSQITWSRLTKCAAYPEFQGMTIHEAAQQLGMEDDYDAVFHLIRSSNGVASGSFFMMDEKEVCSVIAHPRAMICTDSNVAGKSTTYHPRLRAAFPRALGVYAREQQVVSIPEMIRKMTSLPAEVYGLRQKGRIAVGMDADLCIFDPETICDQADFIHCTVPNKGLSYVLIDGKVVLENGVYNGVRAAAVLRRDQN